MRILHLDSGREMRGGQWQVLRLHRGLSEREHDSMLLARAASPLLAACHADKLPCDVLDPRGLAAVSRRFDIVHAHDAHSHTLAAIFARTPFIVSRRVAFPLKRSVLSRWKYARPRLFLAVSHFVAGELLRAGVHPGRVCVIYDGVEIPEVPAHGDAIIAPFTTDSQKGMALTQAASDLAGVPVHFSRDLERDLPTAGALVYITQSEGLGSGILLGMAHGVAVIASRVGGIPELIEHGVNGLLVDNEPAAIAEGIGQIHPSLGVAARQTVIGRFSEDRMVLETIRAYSRVLAS